MTAKEDALKAIAVLMTETVANNEPAKWHEAVRLAQVGGVLARMGGEPRVQDFDNGGNGLGFDNGYGGMVGAVHPQPMRIGGHVGDWQTLERNKQLIIDAVLTQANSSIKSVTAKHEAEELKVLVETRDKLPPQHQATVDKRINAILAAMELRNESPAVMDTTEPPRGHQAGIAIGDINAPHGLRADLGGGEGHDIAQAEGPEAGLA